MTRQVPNILITGTPGTGKSTLSREIAEMCNMEWIEVGHFAKENGCVEEYDYELSSHIINEDKIVDELNDRVIEGGKILDYHGCDFFPEDWIDIVFVLTTDNTVLYDRLAKRGYTGKKLESNLQCEIFQVLLEEAKRAYNPQIVNVLRSNIPDDMETNLEMICQWVQNYKAQHAIG